MPRLPSFEEWDSRKSGGLPTFDEWEAQEPEAPSFEKKFKVFEESLTKGREAVTRAMQPEEFKTGSKLADEGLSFLSNIPRNILGIANLPFELGDAFQNVIEGKQPAFETAGEFAYGIVRPLENFWKFINPYDYELGRLQTPQELYQRWEELRNDPMGPLFTAAIAYGGATGFAKVKGKATAKFDAWRENIPKKIIKEAQKEFVAPKEEVFKKAPEVAPVVKEAARMTFEEFVRKQEQTNFLEIPPRVQEIAKGLGRWEETLREWHNRYKAKAGKKVAERPQLAEPRPPMAEVRKAVPGEEALRVQREMGERLKDVRAKQGTEWAEKQRQAEEGGFLRLGKEKELPYEVQDIKSPTPEVESFFKRTERPTLFEKGTTVAGAIKGRIRGAVVTFEHLKRKGVRKFYADAVEELSVLKGVNRDALAEATADLQGIVQDLSKKQMKLLSRKVFVDDLLWTAEQGKKVPEGLNINNLTLERGRLETLVAKDPELTAGINRYREYSNAVRNDLISRGKLLDDTAVNPSYVHHEILDYARARGHRGFFGPKVQAPKRGYTRARLGSARDIYTDWLEVNFKHFAQVLRDNMIEDGLVKIANRYDLTPKLKQAGFKAKVTKEGYLPEGYVPYSVRRGTLQDVAPKPPVEAKIYEMLDAIASDARTLEVIKDAKGLDGRQVFVIPKELAGALESFKIYEPKSLVNQAVRQWKRVILNVNPVRYNRRNFIGDLERLVVTDPGALPLAGEEALRDIIAAGRGHFTEDFRLAQERGVVGSGRFRIEAERPTKLPEFRRLAAEKNIFQKGYGAYDLLWQKLQKVTGAREDFLRLTQFYANLKRLRSGKPMNSCISKVEGITDPVKACGKIAREALIDYGDFTSWEEALRNGVIPFYSWLKGNTTFWTKTFTQQGFTKRGVKIAGAKVTRTGIKGIVAGVGLMEATAIVWNNLQHPEQEERLPDWQRNRWHLNTGKQTDDGEEIVISDPTALTDFLETVGLEQAIPDIIGVCRGQKDFGEVAKATAWKVAKAPVEALAMKAGPTFQLPYTFFSRKKLFPEPFRGRFVGKGQMPATLFGQVFGPEPKLAWDILAGRREIQELPYRYMPFPVHEVADYGEKKELFPRLRGTP